MTIVPKALVIRVEDYWIVALCVPTVICLAAGMWASVPMFRFPPLLLGLLGLWFTTVEIKKGYGTRHAWLHFGLLIVTSLVLLVALVDLTN